MCVRVRTMRSKGFETHVKERDWALFVGHLISRHQSANRQRPQTSLCRICACLISPWVPAFACTHRVLRPARRAFVLLGGGSKMFGDIRCGTPMGLCELGLSWSCVAAAQQVLSEEPSAFLGVPVRYSASVTLWWGGGWWKCKRFMVVTVG
jgi:hypothetical protein